MLWASAHWTRLLSSPSKSPSPRLASTSRRRCAGKPQSGAAQPQRVRNRPERRAGGHPWLEASTIRGSLEQRRGRGREDVVGVDGVEVDRAVDLEDVAATGRVAGDVDAREVEPERGDRAQRERTRRRRRTHVRTDGAKGDVRPPFAWAGSALDRAEHATAGDDEAQVAARRLDE